MTTRRNAYLILAVLFVPLLVAIVPTTSAQAPDSLSWNLFDPTIDGHDQAQNPTISNSGGRWLVAHTTSTTTTGTSTSVDRFDTKTFVNTTLVGSTAGNGPSTVSYAGTGQEFLVTRAVAGGDDDEWLYTDDGGQTFTTGFITGTQGFGGQASLAFSATDWVAQQTGGSGTLCTFRFTTDSGTSWSTSSGPPGGSPPSGCRHVERISSTGAVFTVEDSTTDGQIKVFKTTDSGATWSATTNVDTDSSNVRPSICAFDQSTYTVLWQNGNDVLASFTTDGGTSWSTPVEADSNVGSNGLHACVMPDSTTAVLTYYGFLIESIRYSWTTDLGGNWTSGDVHTVPEDISVFPTSGDGSMAWDGIRGEAVLVWMDSEEDVMGAYAALEGFGTGGCISQETCTSTKTAETSFADIRTSYTLEPFIFVREEGGSSTVQDLGDLHKFDKDLGLLRTSDGPCQRGDVGSPPYEYWPADQYGLAVTADERVIISCLAITTSDTPVRIQNRIKVLTNATLTEELLVGTTSSQSTEDIPDWTNRRVDAAYSNIVAYSTVAHDLACISMSTLVVQCADNVGTTGGVSVDPATNRTATVNNEGLKIWPPEPTFLLQTLATSGSVTGTAVALYEGTVFVANENRTARYTWTTTDGIGSATHTNTSLPVDPGNDDPGIRMSKDGDYLIHWSGSDAVIVNASDLSGISGPHTLAGGTVSGCDMDVFNNYLYCVTDATIHRIAVYTDVPTTFGIDKNGTFSNTTNTGLTDPFSEDTDLFQDPTTNPGGASQTEEEFLGIDFSANAEALGISLTSFYFFFGLLIIVGMAGTFFFWFDGSIPMAGFGVFLGFAMTIAFGFLGLFWVVLLALVSIAVAVVGFNRRGGF